MRVGGAAVHTPWSSPQAAPLLWAPHKSHKLPLGSLGGDSAMAHV